MLILDRLGDLAEGLEFGKTVDREAASFGKPATHPRQRSLQIVVSQTLAGVCLEIATDCLHDGCLSRSADRGDLVGHFGEHFGDMTNLDIVPLAKELAGDVQQTSEVPRQNRLGPRRDDFSRLVADHLVQMSGYL